MSKIAEEMKEKTTANQEAFDAKVSNESAGSKALCERFEALQSEIAADEHTQQEEGWPDTTYQAIWARLSKLRKEQNEIFDKLKAQGVNVNFYDEKLTFKSNGSALCGYGR